MTKSYTKFDPNEYLQQITSIIEQNEQRAESHSTEDATESREHNEQQEVRRGRPNKSEKEKLSVKINFNCTEELAERIDEEARECGQEMHKTIRRSDVVRIAVEEYLAKQERSRKFASVLN